LLLSLALCFLVEIQCRNFQKHKDLIMKVCIIVLVLGLSMVSCEPAVEKKVDTKEMWGKIKDLFHKLKGKLTNPENVQDAKEETAKDLVAASEQFNDVMVAIGDNIYKFSGKINSQADGKTVQSELAQLGKCGGEVLNAVSEPLAQVVGIMAKKSIDAAKTVTLPDAPPKAVVDSIEKAAIEAKAAAQKAADEAKKNNPPKP